MNAERIPENANCGYSRSAIVVSPQPWHGFRVSKHHYAIALARAGWRVFFVGPPKPFSFDRGVTVEATEVKGVFSVHYPAALPRWFKHRFRVSFDFFTNKIPRRIVQATGPVDLVWDFDNLYYFRDLRLFGANVTIFHLVDRGLEGLGDKFADRRVHLHPSFCEWAGYSASESYPVGHGVSRDFIRQCPPPESRDDLGKSVCFGLVGNLKAQWFDWTAILQIARRHPTARFVLWGPHQDPEFAQGIQAEVFRSPQFEFRGLVQPEDIAASSGEVDIWLVPFDSEKVPGGPLNSHKVLEYLATGGCVAMSYLEAYRGNELVHMVDQNADRGLPDLVSSLVESIESINSRPRMAARQRYAGDRVYEARLRQVLKAIQFESRVV